MTFTIQNSKGLNFILTILFLGWCFKTLGGP